MKTNIGPYIVEGEMKPGSVSKEDAKKIGDSIGVNWKKVDVEQLRRGIEVEMEHAGTVQNLADSDVDNKTAAAKIAIDHISERPDYYTMLDKAEKA